MFTGLIEEIGTVSGIRQTGEGITIAVTASKVLEGTTVGDSIAIDGACQTVTGLSSGSFDVFASRITASVTTLGSLKKGDPVNLERAMSHESRFGGHIVQGHVDGTGVVKKINADSHGREILIELPSGLNRYIADKGSVAVNGISLTVVSLTHAGFSIYLIPETLHNTTIENWREGVQVNIEVDILAKYVERMLNMNNTGDSHDEMLRKKLMEEGFV